MKKKLSVLLVALLLVPLFSGCRFIVPDDTAAAPSFGRYGNPDDWGKDLDNPGDDPYDPAIEVVDNRDAGEFAQWEPGRSLDINFTFSEGLELPVVGATGFASVDLCLWRDMPTSDACKVANGGSESTAPVVATLFHGTSFVILQESGDWWRIRTEFRDSSGGKEGWVEHRYCLINLPDVIPSMIYNDTNSDSSVFMASYTEIAGITGQALYHQSAKKQNARLGREEYMMPVLYTMAKKVCQAQHNALESGNTIVLYEGYRPQDTQMTVVSGVQKLAAANSTVRAGISTYPWSISWFIATSVSNHQQGYAMDISLARVYKSHVETIDGYEYVQVDEYQEYFMPTPIHELSQLACTFTAPVNMLSDTAWQSATMSSAMAKNEPAKAMQGYCTMAQLTPLASEWWHFNDLNAYRSTSAKRSTGNYDISDCECMSQLPSRVK